MRGEWEQLLQHSAGLQPSLTPTWSITWWRVFGSLDRRRLCTLVFHEGRELVGIFPLLERRQWHHRLVPMLRIELLASGEDTADEIYSEYLGPIVARGHESAVIEAFATYLVEQRGSWQELVLTALDCGSPAVRKLEPALRARGFACETREHGHCSYIALPHQWDDYLAMLSSDHRYTAKRSLRDFEQWAGATAQVEVARTYADLRRGMNILQSSTSSGGKRRVRPASLHRLTFGASTAW